MNRIASLPLILSLMLLAGHARAETSGERIYQWQSAINRSLEAGDFNRMQVLREELADYCANVHDYVEAARQYDLLLASRPGKRERVRLFVRLADMRMALQNYGGAITSYQDALHDEPHSYDANFKLAKAYAKADLSSSALAALQRCIALNPSDANAYAETGAVYKRLGYLTRAIEAYKKALHLRPTPESYLGMADCYVRENDVRHATAILEEAKGLLPQAEYDVRLGEIYQHEGNLKKASASWEQALGFDAKRDDVRLKLALVYDRLERKTDADKMLKTLLDKYPKSPLVHFLAAWMFYNRGDRQASQREVSVVNALAPTELVQHYTERLLLQIKQ